MTIQSSSGLVIEKSLLGEQVVKQTASSSDHSRPVSGYVPRHSSTRAEIRFRAGVVGPVSFLYHSRLGARNEVAHQAVGLPNWSRVLPSQSNIQDHPRFDPPVILGEGRERVIAIVSQEVAHAKVCTK